MCTMCSITVLTEAYPNINEMIGQVVTHLIKAVTIGLIIIFNQVTTINLVDPLPFNSNTRDTYNRLRCFICGKNNHHRNNCFYNYDNSNHAELRPMNNMRNQIEDPNINDTSIQSSNTEP